MKILLKHTVQDKLKLFIGTLGDAICSRMIHFSSELLGRKCGCEGML